MDSAELETDLRLTSNLRPDTFDDYPGQTVAKENLKVYVESAKKRNKTLDHILLHGPPGLGKTTLAHIVAHEMGVSFHATSAPAIERAGDLAGILAGLEPGSILFIDEIHRLPIQLEELMYSAMEDFAMDILVGQGSSARTMRVPVSPFTLIGATTRVSLLSRPFQSRFGIQERLEFYDIASLMKIVARTSDILSIKIDGDALELIALSSRGTPRIANRILKRVWDFALVADLDTINEEIALRALSRLDIDSHGLDRTDRVILRTIWERYDGGPVGIEAIAVSIGEDRSTVEEVYEPFLVFQGYLSRGPRGRSITESGKTVLIEPQATM
ncbi:MAG: Holliday junction branch migration DNA helicase RuvB [Pseudomonadota bacterium]